MIEASEAEQAYTAELYWFKQRESVPSDGFRKEDGKTRWSVSVQLAI